MSERASSEPAGAETVAAPVTWRPRPKPGAGVWRWLWLPVLLALVVVVAIPVLVHRANERNGPEA